ncbi:MAG: holo-ACP synthase [Rhodobacteraceae bacterium]|nr:holo-ACP synthase [Paracoccaceae bacterium]
MIVGIGTDIVNIRRIEAALLRHGDRFRHRIFARTELEYASGLSNAGGFLAKRWAAKEACSKALGTGMTQGVAWRDIVVQSRPGSFPSLKLFGKARAHLNRLTPLNHRSFINLSMSDDYPWAVAFVVISAQVDQGCLQSELDAS